MLTFVDDFCSLARQVVTAKSSEVNLLVLAAKPEAEDVAEHCT
jgi:hypothetical protein